MVTIKTYSLSASLLIAGAAAIALSGCNFRPVKDVSYYLEHQEERKHKIEQCNANPGQSSDEAECINAKQAFLKSLLQGDGMPSIK